MCYRRSEGDRSTHDERDERDEIATSSVHCCSRGSFYRFFHFNHNFNVLCATRWQALVARNLIWDPNIASISMAQRPFGGPSGNYEPHQMKDYEDKEEYNYGIRGGRFRRYYICNVLIQVNLGILRLSWRLCM